MTLCPVSLAVGCKKCLLFKLCPLKSVIGNFKKRGIERRSSEKNEKYAGMEKRFMKERRLQAGYPI